MEKGKHTRKEKGKEKVQEIPDSSEEIRESLKKLEEMMKKHIEKVCPELASLMKKLRRYPTRVETTSRLPPFVKWNEVVALEMAIDKEEREGGGDWDWKLEGKPLHSFVVDREEKKSWAKSLAYETLNVLIVTYLRAFGQEPAAVKFEHKCEDAKWGEADIRLVLHSVITMHQ